MSDMMDDTAIMDREDIDIEEPKDYACLMLNDNFTTMEFVVLVLQDVFHKTGEEAERIMLEVHTKGKAEAYRGPWDICETKRHTVMQMAKEKGYPFQVEVAEL